jgi:hypothetical protein
MLPLAMARRAAMATYGSAGSTEYRNPASTGPTMIADCHDAALWAWSRGR